jgi:isopropylmalate/homocitrate/citramalate synthase
MREMIFTRREDSLSLGNTLVDALDERIDHPVHLHDETLRDGEQTAGIAFSAERKIEIAKALFDAGVRFLNAGFPAVSQEERDTVRAIAREGRSARITCLSRPIKSNIEAVIACEVEWVSLFIAISDCHLQHKLHLTPEAAHQKMVDGIRLARSHGLNVRFAFEDLSRTPLERIKRFAGGALEAGAKMITVCDTCGVLTPNTARRLIEALVPVTGGDALVIHFHNDLGLAVANSLAACAGGAFHVQATLLGLGERSGNASLEQMAVALRAKHGLASELALDKLTAAAGRVAEMLGYPIPPTQPIVGANVFGHESGIHVNGILADTATYEAFPPELVGRRHEVRFGKHSGLSNIRFVADRLELALDDARLEEVLAFVKRRGEMNAPPSEAEVEAALRALHDHGR